MTLAFLQGSQCGRWAAPPPVPHPPAAAALSALLDLPQDAPLPQKQCLNTSGENPPSPRSLCNKSSPSLWTFTDSHFAFWAEAQQPERTSVRFLLWSWSSFFYLSLFRSSMRSETTRIPSCTCWLCRVSTLPGTPPPSERAMRSVQLLPLSLCLRHTGLQ